MLIFSNADRPSAALLRSYFLAGAFPVSTGLRSNFPLLWMNSSHSEALSHAEMCL